MLFNAPQFSFGHAKRNSTSSSITDETSVLNIPSRCFFFVFRWSVHTMLVPEWIERVPKSLSEFDSRAQESMKHLHYVIPYCWTSHRIASNLNRSKMLKTIQQQTVKTIYVISCKKEEKLVKLVGFALIRICCVYLVINFHVIRPAISFETRSRCVLDIAEHKIGVNKSQASA